MELEHKGAVVAYDAHQCGPHKKTSPSVVFCSGFKSSRHGNKALALHDYCAEYDLNFVRFDYRAHGDSSGEFGECGINEWLEDVIVVVESLTKGPVILVGSSMGGWLSLLAALALPERIKGLLLIACAADMTRYYPARLEGLHAEVDTKGRAFYRVPNRYDDESDYLVYQHLIDSAPPFYLLDKPINIDCPVRMLHGAQDDVVPWYRSQSVMKNLTGSDVKLTVLKDGDHRLSKEGEQMVIETALCELIAKAE